MQVHNILESNGNGKGFQSGNIRLVKIKEDIVEVFKRDGGVIKFKKVGVLDEAMVSH